jgi:hypothetical protein
MKNPLEIYSLTESYAVRYIKIVFLLVAVLLFFSLKGCFKPQPSPFALPHQTDTIRIAKKAVLKPIPKAEHWPVAIVTIYEKDTTMRTRAEKEDILLNGKIQDGHAEITTITPGGEVKLFTFDIPKIPGVAIIDATGLSFVPDKKAKRKETWKSIWKGVKIAGLAAASGFVIGKATK